MASLPWRLFIFETTGAAPVHRLGESYPAIADNGKCVPCTAGRRKRIAIDRSGGGQAERRPTDLLGFQVRLTAMNAISGQRAMEERRKHQRIEINEPAYVSAGGSVMSCVVRNISPDGAAIDVDNPAFVPARFRLVMANGRTVHDCIVAWIQKSRIGVTFVGTTSTP
jgi:hypothetical protein